MRKETDMGPRLFAVLAYLLPVAGPVIALLLGRHRLAVWHARQALFLLVLLVAVCLAWGLLAWVLNWIPVIGAIAGVMLFAFIPLWLAAMLAAHIGGILLALKASYGYVPVLGGILAQLMSAK